MDGNKTVQSLRAGTLGYREMDANDKPAGSFTTAVTVSNHRRDPTTVYMTAEGAAAFKKLTEDEKVFGISVQPNTGLTNWIISFIPGMKNEFQGSTTKK